MRKLAILFILFFTSSFPQTYPVIQDFLISGNDNAPSTFKQNNPELNVTNDSNFVVTWSDYRNGDPSTYAQLFDNSGNKIGLNFNINSNYSAYTNVNKYIFTLTETYSDNYYFNYFYINGNLFFNSTNIVKSIPVFSGQYPDCGTGFIGGEELISSSSNGFYYLTNYGGNLDLVKIKTNGVPEYFNFPYYYTITQITSAATSEGDYFFSWINGMDNDSMKSGLYATFANRQDSIIKDLFITELLDTVGIWNYIGNYNLKSISLNDSTYELFWLNNASLKLYSLKINNLGEIISDIDSIQIPKPNGNYSNSPDVIITNKREDGFYLRLSWIKYLDDPVYINYFIKYNLNGEQYGDIIEKESDEYDNNLFYAGSDKFLNTSSDDKDVYLNKFDFNGIIEKEKINDDKSGSNETNQKLINYDENSVLAIWNDEEKSYCIKISKDGKTIGSKLELKNSDIYLFPDKESVSPWVKKNPDTTYSAGYTIFDKDFKEKFSKTLITKSSDYNLKLQIHIISDSVFIALLNSFDEIKLIKEDKNGETEFEKLIASGSLLTQAKMYFDDLKSPATDNFWLYWNGHLTEFSYNFIQLAGEKKFNHTIHGYLGDDKFLTVGTQIDPYTNNVLIIGTIFNSDDDTLKTGIHFGFIKNNSYEFQIGRITSDKFLTVVKYGKNFYARAFTNSGIAKKDSFLVNRRSYSNTSNLAFTVNNEKVFFTWSDAETQGKGYDIYCSIFNLSSIITGIKQNAPLIPEVFNLYQNYPNPFNPSTIIKYSLAENCFVKITLYDILGRKIKDLFIGEQEPGLHEINLDISDLKVTLSSGIYLYTINAQYKNGVYRDSKKMVLLK